MAMKFPSKDKDLAAHTLGAYRLVPHGEDVPPVRFSFGSIPVDWNGEVQVLPMVAVPDGDTQKMEPAGDREPTTYSVYAQLPDGTHEWVADFEGYSMRQDAEALAAHMAKLHECANEGISPWSRLPRAYLKPSSQEEIDDVRSKGGHFDERLKAWYTAQGDEHLTYLKKTYLDRAMQKAALKYYKEEAAKHVIDNRKRDGASPLEQPAPKMQHTPAAPTDNIAAQQQPQTAPRPAANFGFRNTPRAAPMYKNMPAAQQQPSQPETQPPAFLEDFIADLRRRSKFFEMETQVVYMLDGKPVFRISTKTEDHYTMQPDSIDNDEAIALALLQAKDRFRDGIEITGDDAFKERAIRVMVKYGIDAPLSLPAQQKMLESIRATQQQAAPAQELQRPDAQKPGVAAAPAPNQAQVIDINDAKQQRAQQTRMPAPSM